MVGGISEEILIHRVDKNPNTAATTTTVTIIPTLSIDVNRFYHEFD